MEYTHIKGLSQDGYSYSRPHHDTLTANVISLMALSKASEHLCVIEHHIYIITNAIIE